MRQSTFIYSYLHATSKFAVVLYLHDSSTRYEHSSVDSSDRAFINRERSVYIEIDVTFTLLKTYRTKIKRIFPVSTQSMNCLRFETQS